MQKGFLIKRGYIKSRILCVTKYVICVTEKVNSKYKEHLWKGLYMQLDLVLVIMK